MSRDSILDTHFSSNAGAMKGLSINSLSLDDFRQYKSANRHISAEGTPLLRLV